MSADAVRAAYEALAEGDVDPLVSLMREDMLWQGRRNPWRFWQPVPFWRGPNEAREVLQSGIESRRRAGESDYTLDRFEATDRAVAVAFSWTVGDGSRARWAQSLILRAGQIAHIQDYADPAKAFKAIGRWELLDADRSRRSEAPRLPRAGLPWGKEEDRTPIPTATRSGSVRVLALDSQQQSSPDCFGGHIWSEYEQKTQQSPGNGLSVVSHDPQV